MKCWHCGSEVVWQNDYDLYNPDNLGEIKGILSILTCSNDECGATYECSATNESVMHSKAFKDNKPKKLPEVLLKQLDWAKTTMIGETFMNKKTKGIYYVKGVTVDTETMELRVIYVDGVSTNEWDRPLGLFIEKFKRIIGGRKYEEQI